MAGTRRGRRTTRSLYRCLACKNIVVIQRVGAQKKEKGHIKHMWCFKCKKHTGHMLLSK